MTEKLDEMSNTIRKRPTDALALGRTILANERTLLAFLRTGIGLLGGGIAIVGYVDRPLVVGLGWAAITVSIPLLVWGTGRFLMINRTLSRFKEDLAE